MSGGGQTTTSLTTQESVEELEDERKAGRTPIFFPKGKTKICLVLPAPIRKKNY